MSATIFFAMGMTWGASAERLAGSLRNTKSVSTFPRDWIVMLIS